MTPSKGPRGQFGAEPPRERPDSPPPSYGVPRTGGTFVDWQHVVSRLESAEAYWLATVTPGGHPHAVPIWGVLLAADLYLETGAPETRKNRNLSSNDRVAVHLDGITDVVIVRGRGTPMRPDRDLEGDLIAAFRAKYPGYHPQPGGWDHGGLVLIEPTAVLAWGDMDTATRWRFTRRAVHGRARQRRSELIPE